MSYVEQFYRARVARPHYSRKVHCLAARIMVGAEVLGPSDFFTHRLPYVQDWEGGPGYSGIELRQIEDTVSKLEHIEKHGFTP